MVPCAAAAAPLVAPPHDTTHAVVSVLVLAHAARPEAAVARDVVEALAVALGAAAVHAL